MIKKALDDHASERRFRLARASRVEAALQSVIGLSVRNDHGRLLLRWADHTEQEIKIR